MGFLVEPNKKAVGILSAGHIMADLYGGFLTPIMPFIAAKLSMSLAMVGILLTVSTFTSSLLQPFYGYISDLLTRRIFIISGLILAAVFTSLIGCVDSIWLLITVTFLGSLGVGLFHPQATSMAGHFSGKDINHLMGIYIACGTLGFAGGSLLSSFLVRFFGLNSTIYAAIPGLIIAVLTYKILPAVPTRLEYPDFKSTLKTVLDLKNILIPLSFMIVIRSLSTITFIIFMPFLWKENNMSLMFIGLLTALFSFSGGLAAYLGGKLNGFLSEKTILLWALIPAMPCMLGTLYFLKSFPSLSFILFVLAGFILALANSVNVVIAQKAAPQNLGVISGIIGGFSWGMVSLILTPIGFLAKNFGIEPVLTTIAFTPILGAISIFFLPKIYSKSA